VNKRESGAIGGTRSGVLNYAPNTTGTPNRAQSTLVSVSMLCPVLFMGYTCGLFGHEFLLLMLILVAGLTASVLAVAMSGKEMTRWAFSFVGLCLNVVCSGIVAYYLFNSD
jgi:hypothetical protein